ncbi:hypothetical protein K503DRAFT_805670 [Rhizopogon vinicolor AM-OR11-026]|uniref:F-box domain-containing protein n=1 Tax=Rhizopogon vinicolor AM-OR11-026 TaxID=1314800 RepID=A0A1B7MH39_9AGAM|nr:hypothetical protein K503DRAFT_805670 [Rhizopogon vinicolor AM-OR11-026]
MSLHIISALPSDAPELQLNLPALQELTLCWSVICRRDMIISQSLSSLPCLHNLKLKGIRVDPIKERNIWAHLTHLEITLYRQREFFCFLQLCPNLSSLKVDFAFKDVVEALEPLTHTNLQSLSISCSKRDAARSLPDLFNALTLPNLRMFEARHTGVSHYEGLKALWTRSNCALERLIFGAGVRMTDEQRAEYLSLIPSLEIVLDPKRYNFFG